MMTSPRYSIVIPTRHRANTLRHSLRTCLDLEYDDFEIVVSDNCSSPETRRVVEEADSPRVVYVRSDKPISLSANWELGVSRARGEFVTLLGDDDGIMPYALRELDALQRQHPSCRAFQWARGFYSWPCCPVPGGANHITIPYVRGMVVQDGVRWIQRIGAFQADFGDLPMIYAAAIRRDLIAELRSKCGSVFPTRYPDVFTGIAFAYLEPRYVSVTVPFALIGISARSNGAAVHVLQGGNEVARDFANLNAADGLGLHPWIPELTAVENAVADTVLQAKERLYPDDRRIQPDRKVIVANLLKSIPLKSLERERPILRATLRDEPSLQTWFDSLPDPGPPVKRSLMANPFGADGHCIHLRADRFGITNVHDAVKFTKELLFADGTAPVRYDTSPYKPPKPKGLAVVGREVKRLMSQGARLFGLAEKQAV